jgi:Zn-dependent peptidase ImmA (M78 family)
VLDFPAAFFTGDDLNEVREDAVSFRALSSMGARQVRRVLASATITQAFSAWIDERYDTPSVNVPNIADLIPVQNREEPNPVEAAETLRLQWGLGVRPIKDLLGLLESRGIRVFSIPPEDRAVDAFAFWLDGRPFVFLDTSKSAERIRFDLAHELGHLCMHRMAGTRRERALEAAANNFASSFLMPAQGIYAQVTGRLTLPDVITLKRDWRVSAVAMVRRLRQLECIGEWHYRTWMIELTQNGYRAAEPDGIAPEMSALLRKVLDLAREDGWPVPRLAKVMGLEAAHLQDSLGGLVILTISGGGSGTDASSTARTTHLRSVK